MPAGAILAEELLDALEQPHPLIRHRTRARVVMDGGAAAFVVLDRRYKEDGPDLCALVFPKLLLEPLHQSGRYFPDLRLIYWHPILLRYLLPSSLTLCANRT